MPIFFFFCNINSVRKFFPFPVISSILLLSCSLICCSQEDLQFESDAEFEYAIYLPSVFNSEKLTFLEWEITVAAKNKTLNFRTSDCCTSVKAKNYPTAVIAVPHFTEEQGTAIFKPCGTVLPYSNNLTWEAGYAAKILSEIYSKSRAQKFSSERIVFHTSCFNWGKFLMTLKSKGKSKNFNPWLLSKERIEQNIMENNFTVSDLSQSKSILISKLDLLQKADLFLYGCNLDFSTKTIDVTSDYFPLLENDCIPFMPEGDFQTFVTTNNGDSFYANIKAATSKNFSVELIKCR